MRLGEIDLAVGLIALEDAPSGEIFVRDPSPGPCQSACRIPTS